jgi:primary-amine oxidase
MVSRQDFAGIERPVMPVVTIGFMLKPVGFFDRNPGLDVPRPTPHGDCCSSG